MGTQENRHAEVELLTPAKFRYVSQSLVTPPNLLIIRLNVTRFTQQI